MTIVMETFITLQDNYFRDISVCDAIARSMTKWLTKRNSHPVRFYNYMFIGVHLAEPLITIDNARMKPTASSPQVL